MKRAVRPLGQGAGTCGTTEYAAANDVECADYVVCVCHNNPVWGGGFGPATMAGPTSADKDSDWDGHLIACYDCGRLIDTNPLRGIPVPTTSHDDVMPWLFPVVGTVIIDFEDMERRGL